MEMMGLGQKSRQEAAEFLLDYGAKRIPLFLIIDTSNVIRALLAHEISDNRAAS